MLIHMYFSSSQVDFADDNFDGRIIQLSCFFCGEFQCHLVGKSGTDCVLGKTIHVGAPFVGSFYEHNSCYFEFAFSIDATKDNAGLCRYVNDCWRKPNAKMRKILVNGNVHLALFANSSIDIGQEVVYDYGYTSASWRKVRFTCTILCLPFTGELLV